MIKFHKIGTFDYNSLPFDEFFVARKGGWSKGRLPTSRVHRSRCAARPRDKCARDGKLVDFCRKVLARSNKKFYLCSLNCV